MRQHPLPSGTRDVLPDEMRELRAIEAAIRTVFAARGYGEISTPALEYESAAAAATPGYRVFDEHGEVLVLRADMTVPIARVAATRYAEADGPLRFCYVAYAYRANRPYLGLARELLQAGIELIGRPGPEGTAEAIEVLCETLDAVGLEHHRVGVGDASLFPGLLDRAGITGEARRQALHELVTRDFVGLRRELRAADAEELLEIAQRRGGPEILDAAPALRELHALLSPAAAARVIYDLGLSRDLGYYTGAIFEVYDRALGQPLGGGGRYDELVGRFGDGDRPAVGWALGVERLHRALVGEGGGR